MVLLGKTFHGSSEGLNLSLKGGGVWLVSLNVVGGHHQASKHHTTLCSGNDSMALQVIMVLLGKTFHGSSEGLNLSLEGGGVWLISLNVVGGDHRASKHHTTLCSGNDSMALQVKISHRRCQLIMPKIVNKSHSPHVLETTPAKQKQRRPCRGY